MVDKVDLEQMDWAYKSAGLTPVQRLEKIAPYLSPGAKFPDSLLQDLEKLKLPEEDESEEENG